MHALLAASTGQIVLYLVVASVLFCAWLVSLFVLVLDHISFGAKVVWFVLIVCLAPVSIPIYFYLRHRRRTQAPATALDN
jgi:hypothetical protein